MATRTRGDLPPTRFPRSNYDRHRTRNIVCSLGGRLGVASADKPTRSRAATSNLQAGASPNLKFNMFRAISLVALTLMLAGSPVLAKQKAQETVVIADTAEKFAVLVDKIRSQMATGQRYEFLNASDRKKVNQSLDRMSALLDASGSVEAMTKDNRALLFNEQEKANGILARNADDRLICTRVAPTGSHRPVTDCKTYRETEEIRKNSRTQLNEMTRYRGNPGPQN